MKPIFNIILVLSVISCGGNDSIDEIPKPVEKNTYSFEYNHYNVKDIIHYKGPAGQKSTPDENYLNNYWSFYKEPTWKKINLDVKNSSIHFISETSSDKIYTIKIVNDSIFIDNDSPSEYIGIFNKKEPSLTLKRSFIYVKKAPRATSNALIISQKNIFGISCYNNIFGNAIFNNPSEMTKSDDQILWSNIDYYYKIL